ncbi:MAG: tyrosine-type recombinase/integrase [Nitrospiria bacterium]
MTVHFLRHTAANLELDDGAPIVQVQEMMRHKKIETTMIYVKKRI